MRHDGDTFRALETYYRDMADSELAEEALFTARLLSNISNTMAIINAERNRRSAFDQEADVVDLADRLPGQRQPLDERQDV